mgnify:FL=1
MFPVLFSVYMLIKNERNIKDYCLQEVAKPEERLVELDSLHHACLGIPFEEEPG